MKKLIISICAFLFLILSVSFSQAGFLNELKDLGTPDLIYCQDEEDCSVDKSLDQIRKIDAFVQDKPASAYVQDVVAYVLSFISIVAVIYIIYAGFMILTSNGDDDKVSQQKKTIMYVVIGLIVIFLAYSIVVFIFDVFETPTQDVEKVPMEIMG